MKLYKRSDKIPKEGKMKVFQRHNVFVKIFTEIKDKTRFHHSTVFEYGLDYTGSEDVMDYTSTDMNAANDYDILGMTARCIPYYRYAHVYDIKQGLNFIRKYMIDHKKYEYQWIRK